MGWSLLSPKGKWEGERERGRRSAMLGKYLGILVGGEVREAGWKGF